MVIWIAICVVYILIWIFQRYLIWSQNNQTTRNMESLCTSARNAVVPKCLATDKRSANSCRYVAPNWLIDQYKKDYYGCVYNTTLLEATYGDNGLQYFTCGRPPQRR
jgi:hypothetical protein